MLHLRNDFMEFLIARYGEDMANQIMVQRLRQISDGRILGTIADYNFYSHELREFTRLRTLGYEHGLPPHDAYYNAHTAALLEYGVRPNTWEQSLKALYHSDAIRWIK